MTVSDVKRLLTSVYENAVIYVDSTELEEKRRVLNVTIITDTEDDTNDAEQFILNI